MATKAVAVAVLAVAVLAAAFLLHGPPGPDVPPGDAPPRGTAAAAPAGPPAGGAAAAAHPPAGEAAPAPAAAGAAPGHPPGTGEIPADRAGFAVEVVDEEGVPVRAGTLEVSPSLFDFDRLERLAEELKAWKGVIEPRDLALENPFVVGDLPGKVAGVRLTAAARAPGFAPAEEEEFALKAGTLVRVRVVLARERPLEVVVVEAEGGGPVAGARVVSLSERSRRKAWSAPEDAEAPGRAVTGPDGRCRVEGLGPGLHDFEVLAPGFRAARVRDRDLDAGPLAVRLERSRDTGVLEVLVLAPDGTPVRGMGVRLQAPGRRLPVQGRTDAEGIARFEGLGEGFPFVSVDPEEWARTSRERSWPKDPDPAYSAALKLAAGETRRAVLGWARGDAEIRVEVVDGAGKPAPGVRVRLAGPSRREADTGADGRAAFAGLQAGAYRVVTLRAEEWWEREDLDLPPAGRREARVALGDRVLRGVVREPGGKPVRGAQVAIYGPRFRSVATGEDGAFEVREALPGSYEVHAAADGYAGGMAPADVPAGGEAPPVQVLLQRGGRVLVRPAGGPGAAVPQDLRLENAEGEACTLLEEAAGPFPRVSPPLCPGTYVLRWTAPDGAPRRREVPVRDGEDVEVDAGGP
jgi:hypothetical protein